MDIVLFVLRILIALALYAFVGVILLVLLREQRPAQASAPSAASIARLGADSTRYTLARNGPTWIGRDPNCAIRINNEFVSARHARVEWQADKRAWWIDDNASRNGTRVNSQPVMRCELRAGDIIIIGGVELRFELISPQT
jgi:predicted component of type VI protein secretion system